MMPITTNSSTSVNPVRFESNFGIAVLTQHILTGFVAD